MSIACREREGRREGKRERETDRRTEREGGGGGSRDGVDRLKEEKRQAK